MPSLISDAMLDAFTLRGSWSELPAKVLKKYHGLLDRVSYYFPLVPGENEDGWRATVAGFKTGADWRSLTLRRSGAFLNAMFGIVESANRSSVT